MSEERHRKPTLSAAGHRAAEEQRQRLAAALRENLRKRKTQEKARSNHRRMPSGDSGDRGDGTL